MGKRWSIKMLAEGGMMIALSILLSQIKVYQAPNGGSVSAGSMIPIILFSIRWGLAPGLVLGASYGVLDFILKPYFYHPIQFILDYPLAYGLLGLAGIAYYIKDKDSPKGYLSVFLSIVLAILGRMLSHVLAGVIFFAEYAGDKNPWIYSIGYNATYLIPELIITCIVIAMIWRPLRKTINAK